MRVAKITRDGQTVDAVPIADAMRVGPGYGVYQLFDVEGSLIYTGRTKNLPERLRHHSNTQPFWPTVAYASWVPCADYGEAVALERHAISTEPGRANILTVVDLDGPADRCRQTLHESAARRLRDTYALSDDPLMYEAASSYMRALREAGWSLQAIATPLNITRERIRQRIAKAAQDLDLIVPQPPMAWDGKKTRPTIHQSDRDRLAELQQLAGGVRGSTALDSPARRASEDLSELMAELKMRGVTDREIADAAGVKPITVQMRLARHGYRRTPASLNRYRGVRTVPVMQLSGKDACFRGHDLTQPNAVRFINNDPTRPVCRACSRLRSAQYQERKRLRSTA